MNKDIGGYGADQEMARYKEMAVQNQRNNGISDTVAISRDTAVDQIQSRLQRMAARLSDANMQTRGLLDRLMGPVPTAGKTSGSQTSPAESAFASIARLLSDLEDEVADAAGLAERGQEIA